MGKEKVTLSPFTGVKAIYNRGELVYADSIADAIIDDLQPGPDLQKLGYGSSTIKNRNDNHVGV